MAYTDHELDEAAQRFADQAERLDPARQRAEIIDDLRAVAVAADAVAASEARLGEAVARAHGRS